MIMSKYLHLGSRLAALAAITGLAACAGDPLPTEQPTFYRSMASAEAKVDGPTAASMITGYRHNNGLGAVEVDPELMRLAYERASAMAAKDKLDKGTSREFSKSLAAAGYNPKQSVENISAGYHTLAEAFSGWRDSPPHRANMLKSGATQMGIAAVYTPSSKYKVYWTLILATPDEPKG